MEKCHQNGKLVVGEEALLGHPENTKGLLESRNTLENWAFGCQKNETFSNIQINDYKFDLQKTPKYCNIFQLN